MKREEQTVKSKLNIAARSSKQQPPKNLKEAEQRATELPGGGASVAAELKNRKK